MTALTDREAADARTAAAHELVGVVRALLLTAERDRLGRVVITLGTRTLPNLVDTYNRATYSDPISADDVGR